VKHESTLAYTRTLWKKVRNTSFDYHRSTGLIHDVAVMCRCDYVHSGQRVAVVDLSVHKLDVQLPYVHCNRTIAKLLADLNIPPFIVCTESSLCSHFNYIV